MADLATASSWERGKTAESRQTARTAGIYARGGALSMPDWRRSGRQGRGRRRWSGHPGKVC